MKPTTPPTFGSYAIPIIDSIPRTYYIPCSSTASYQSEWGTERNYVEAQTFDIHLFTIDSTMGKATVTTKPSCTTPAVITATPNPGATFACWSNGNTSNPYTLSQDTPLTAIFNMTIHDTTYLHDTIYVHDTITEEQNWLSKQLSLAT